MLGILVGMDQMDSYVARFWCLWFRLQKIAEIPQLQFIKVVDTPFVTQRLIPVVLVTKEIPQWGVDKVVDEPLCRTSRFPCRGAEADSHGPDFVGPQRFLQLLHKVIDVPVCRSCRSFTSLLMRRGGFPWSVARHGVRCPCCTGRAVRRFCRGAEAVSHGPGCVAVRGTSPVAFHLQGDRRPSVQIGCFCTRQEAW